MSAIALRKSHCFPFIASHPIISEHSRVANSPQVHREDTTDEGVTYEELSASIGRLTTSSAYDDNRIMDNIMAAAEQIGEEVASMSAEELLKTNVARYVESEMVERMNQ